MRVLDEAWAFTVFIHLTDEADDGTTPLYDDTVLPVEEEGSDHAVPAPSLAVVGGSLRWCPGGEPGPHRTDARPPRFRLLVEDSATPAGRPADGVLSVPTGVLVVSDSSLHPWRRSSVPVGDHEVRVSTVADDHDVVHEVALRPVRPGRPVPPSPGTGQP